jgi:hypothetical protein
MAGAGEGARHPAAVMLLRARFLPPLPLLAHSNLWPGITVPLPPIWELCPIP